MENAGVQKKQATETPSIVRAFWDPFGFVQQMFGWGRSVEGPLFEFKETDDTYVCKVKLTLPDQADVAHAKAELDKGELTLVVPKAAAAMSERESSSRSSGATPAPASPPRRGRRAKGSGNGRAKGSGNGGGAGRSPRARASRG